ncbi:hypothetical protein HELRODRAFT_173907 [Helobdella robusta]|uniref:Uncharacterized protein n=1 Tax=Helobdella robusta TaxID=6412 RepID=T1F7C8_HELRO|nr:hypothetical protein HELRODRAFT_173907 [Helobdella robusta]ESO03040.1 hypothetical protein HELRODRAFT_173907 [Helobdella robusta]
MHAKNQVKQYIDHGLDCDFVAFNPPQSALHYRNPDRHREILSFVSKHELSRVIQAFKIADCVALQIDKSVDKYNADSLFVTARYMDNTNLVMKASFLCECHSELRGVIGMMGENSNTGRHGGLWVKMSEYLGHNMLTFWCIAHRSDLAFESVENVVPEFCHWLTDVKNVATYFRGSSYRQENLLQVWVRLLNIFHGIIKARGFLKDCSQTSFNLNMSAAALNILRQFTDLQKETKRTFVTLADLMQKRDHVLQRLSMMRRLDVDQDLEVKAMIDVANAENAEAMIKAGRQIVSDIFGDNYVSEFVDDAVGFYSSFGASSFKPHESNTAKLYLLLQKTTPSSLLNKLVRTFLITCPHSVITERVISCHTELKSDLRSSMSRNTANDRLCIALNAIGTANFDPRPPLAEDQKRDDRLYQMMNFTETGNL